MCVVSVLLCVYVLYRLQAYFYCNQGYHLVGPSYLQCRLSKNYSTGFWPSHIPICEGI